jgi:acyl-CoA thioester hydrolase
VTGVDDTFRVHITVRGYELDTQGHLNWAQYLHYAEHARWECLRAAGIEHERLIGSGVGPVNLDANVRFLAELRAGDELTVSCVYHWRNGKTFRISQQFIRADGTLSAELSTVSGLIDLTGRRLIPEPGKHLRSLATAPEILGL